MPSCGPTSTGWLARCWPSGSRRATGSASGRRTAPSGRSCSTPPPRSAPSSSTSTPPTGRTSCSTSSTRPASATLVAAESFKSSNYRAMVDEVRGEVPGARATSSTSARPTGTAARPRRRGRRRASWRGVQAGLRADRPDQHPVHLGHHRIPQGRDAEPPQHPQQRLLRRRAAATTPRPTASASRCPSTTASAWSWATSRARPTAPAWSSRRPASTRPRPCEADAGREGHLALRRADDVHRRVEPAGLRRLRPVDRAHRHHGRIALSRRADEASSSRPASRR